MYTTCIYCLKPLGANQSIERFPVGRRLAFDAGKGRLWVVCRACERWNLSPLETRWEAIEECERWFSATRLRMSTDHIGMARLADGLELVRIGEPQRPEFAAWRYGDQFGRRRRRAYLIAGGAVLAVGGVLAGAAAAGIGVGAFGGMWSSLYQGLIGLRKVTLVTDDGSILTVRGNQFPSIEFGAAGDDPLLVLKRGRRRIAEFRGAEALRHTGRLLPAVNAAGGTKGAVREAVRALEERGGSEAFLEDHLARTKFRTIKPQRFQDLSTATKLALEMALHEEAERRAIAGELAVLEYAWREAEAIAAIADDLLVPGAVERKLSEMKGVAHGDRA